MDYHIVVETKHKRFLWFFRRVEYQRPLAGYSMIEYAEGKIFELEKLHGIGFYSFHIEEIRCYDN